MRERDLEEKFRQEVKKAGGKAYKFISPGNSGVPDRIVVLPGGKIGFVELKQKGRKPTPLQKAQIHHLVKAGCYVNVLDDGEDIPWMLQDIKDWDASCRSVYELEGILESRGYV